jgi:RND family efflux transporter MFP subunit
MMRTGKNHAPLRIYLLCLIGACGNAPALEVPELDCVIEPHIVVDLSSRTDGIVEAIDVDRGDLVQEGQAVVRLEAGVERAAVEYARAAASAESELRSREVQMTFAQRRRSRLEGLYREQALSSDQMDEMETEAVLTKLELAQAEERKRLAELELRQALEVLERHTVRSPITGVVVQRFLAPGESVEEKPIIRLAQIDPLRVEVIVPVSHFGSIRVGQQAVVLPERPMQNAYPAEVTLVYLVAFG